MFRRINLFWEDLLGNDISSECIFLKYIITSNITIFFGLFLKMTNKKFSCHIWFEFWRNWYSELNIIYGENTVKFQIFLKSRVNSLMVPFTEIWPFGFFQMSFSFFEANHFFKKVSQIWVQHFTEFTNFSFKIANV